MTITAILERIESTNLSIAIREGGLPYPIIGGLHLLAIPLFGGMILVTDFRLLGWVMTRTSVSDVMRQLRPWKWLGFALIVATGLLLAWAEPIRLYKSPSFLIKMVLFASFGLHSLIFRDGVYRHPERFDSGIPLQSKLAAALSLLLWAGLIVSGRLIAFDASFDE